MAIGFYSLTEWRLIRRLAISCYIQPYLQMIIYRSEVESVITKCVELKTMPNWDSLTSIMLKKHGGYFTERVLLDAKVKWNGYTNNSEECAKNLVLFVSKYGSCMHNNELNQYAWTVFQYSNAGK